MNYPKRLIEVDLPIRRISQHAKNEKDMRRGHIPLIHIYPAARPLAACRAIICAALWPDPDDEHCPEGFRIEAKKEMLRWARAHVNMLSKESYKRFKGIEKNPNLLASGEQLRLALLDFIADFSDPENSSKKEYLNTARILTKHAHEFLNGLTAAKPFICDPFAGGGAIPIESLRIGADVFASDLNPLSILINKFVIEQIPKHGEQLRQEIEKWIEWVKAEAKTELAKYYTSGLKGGTPIAYIWARTVTCEGPKCGAIIPLIRSLWLSKKGAQPSALRVVVDKNSKKIEFDIIRKQKNVWTTSTGERVKSDSIRFEGTIKRGSAVCPVCGHTTNVKSIRRQLSEKQGGTKDARLVCIVYTLAGRRGRDYQLPQKQDIKALDASSVRIRSWNPTRTADLVSIPDEPTSQYHSFVNRGPIYGMTKWADYFTDRQLLANATYTRLIYEAFGKIRKSHNKEFATAVQTGLALMVDKMIDMNASLCVWQNHAEIPAHVFGRWALPMVFDFAETNPTAGSSGSPESSGKRLLEGIDTILAADLVPGTANLSSATSIPLPDESVHALVTDPPYYYSIQYADVMDYFYVWIRRMLSETVPNLFSSPLIERDNEIIVQSPGHENAPEGKNKLFYETKMKLALREGRRILSPNGIGVVVFAHASTAGWEAMLKALIEAGWIVTGSWPIDTEMASRVIARGRSVLASSIHLVCRPRITTDGHGLVGDWRDVLAELPKRIHAWMPRLGKEGVIGADAIFACLGPALEIFSKYERVEKANGESVSLSQYLENVWGAVAREALTMIFDDVDTSGFEEDARLTAMWLWTLSTQSLDDKDTSDEGVDEDDDVIIAAGFNLEYDAARKIAQGIGAHLEELSRIVEVKGDNARLLSIDERKAILFEGPNKAEQITKRKRGAQTVLFGNAEEVSTAQELGYSKERRAETVLDRVHQAMILFGSGKTAALKRLLLDEGVGRNQRFWKLAQALNALYPKDSNERRWVEGVQTFKKSLGF